MAKTSAPWVASLCDKCGQPVPESNSVAKVELHVFGNGGAAVARGDRHLNPVTGEHPCVGSPSRVRVLWSDHCYPLGAIIDTTFLGRQNERPR
jgi:hypothetical protein